VTPVGVALAIAAGTTFRWGVMNVPVNFAVVPTKAGVRVNLLLDGWASHLLNVIAVTPALCAGPPDWPAWNQVSGFLALPPTAQAWLDKAKEQPGSWWPDWDAWLQGHAGKQVPAPKTPGNRQYRPTEPAPGRYVKQKA